MLAAQCNLVQRPQRAFSPGTGVFTGARLCRNRSRVSDSTQVWVSFSLDKFCPYTVPVGVDLVLHWIGYTSVAQVVALLDLVKNLHSFSPMGSIRSPPRPSSIGEVHGPAHGHKSNTASHGLALLAVMAIPTLDFIQRSSNMRKRTKHMGFHQPLQFSLPDAKLSMGSGLPSGGQRAWSQMTLGSKSRGKGTETRTAKARQILMQPQGQWKQLPLVILSWNEKLKLIPLAFPRGSGIQN